MADQELPRTNSMPGLAPGDWDMPPSALGLLAESPLFEPFRKLAPPLWLRSLGPGQQQPVRIGGRDYLAAFPLTFTPYAATKPCSARCWFCSEALRLEADSRSADRQRPAADYYQQLAHALAALRDIPLGLSLSGLEITDDADWLRNTLAVISTWQTAGGRYTERAAYSNAAGFAGTDGPAMMQALANLGLDRLEVSRHHHDADRNQSIMRFRPGQRIRHQEVFTDTVRRLQAQLPVTLVCILQQQGIETLADVTAYLDWARDLGVRRVIFRELSMVPDNYRSNQTYRLITSRRQGIEDVLRQWLELYLAPASAMVAGYYFWNVSFALPWGEVTFERSDYAHLQRHHDSSVIHKLVFHGNGNLCAGWHPERQVLLQGNHHDHQ